MFLLTIETFSHLHFNRVHTTLAKYNSETVLWIQGLNANFTGRIENADLSFLELNVTILTDKNEQLSRYNVSICV